MATTTRAPGGAGPSIPLYLTEPARGLADLAFLPLAAGWLASAPRGDGHGVLVLPGLLASDMSTTLLRRYASWLGYDVHGWQLGRNVGPTSRVLDELPRELAGLAERTGGPVSLIGWSLGGIYARELAREHPEHIRRGHHARQPVRALRRAAEPGRWRLPAAQLAARGRPGPDLGPAGPADRGAVDGDLLPPRRHRLVADLHRAGDRAARERRGPLRPPRLRRGPGHAVGHRGPAGAAARTASSIPPAVAAARAVSAAAMTPPVPR